MIRFAGDFLCLQLDGITQAVISSVHDRRTGTDFSWTSRGIPRGSRQI